MNPKKRGLLQARLSGIEFRNQQRQTRRRFWLTSHLQRKASGTARRYELEYSRALLSTGPKPTGAANV